DRVLKEAVSADHSNRQALSQLFSQARDYLQTLPAHFQTDLQHVFPDFLHKLDNTVAQLKTSECTILVAGETGAGKSSLVNLVAGCQILPTDLILGTKTICELRHSETRKFMAYPWSRNHGVLVKECRHGDDVQRFLKELHYHVTYSDIQTDESPYEKIEIFWPLPILGEGVVMVDSPGVGESKVSRQLQSYMNRAFGFIYVINVSNAGGIHRNRLGQLLRQAVERNGFDPSTALFVCNWWDQVAPHEQEHVLNVILDRLGKVMPGVCRDQLFPISSTRALQVIERGTVTGEYRALVKGIRRVLPRTFNAKLSTYYNWLSGVLKRSLYSVKISYNIGQKQMKEKEATYHTVRNQIEALERDAEDRIEEMKDRFKREVELVSRKLIAYMKADGLREMTTWSSRDCPPPDKKWQSVAKEAASKFAERLAIVVDDWEQQNKMVGKIRLNILEKFKRDLDLFEDQIKQLEEVLFEGIDKRLVTDFHNSMQRAMPVKNVWMKARTRTRDSGFLSLGTAISECRTADVTGNPLKNVFRNYDARNPQALEEASRLFLEQIKDEDIASATKKFFDRIAKRFDAASRLLPEFLKADQELLETLQGEVKGEQERLVSMYPQLLDSCSQLQGDLDMFFVQRLMSFEFSMDDLKYDAGKRIGDGSFAEIYRSQIPGPDGHITVALKIQKEKLKRSNVTDVLLEDRTLRDIEHKNIIRYYGAALVHQDNTMRWVMVMEYCTRTIKQRFIDDPEARVPGRVEIASLLVDAMREVAHFALQICSALCYLHNRGILTESDVVKLADVGLAKRAIDITCTYTGTPAYMAPEILLQSGQYDMRADIYSLAIILWELWYGRDAAEHIESELKHRNTRLELRVQEGLRPSLTMAPKPPDDWVKLLQSGWEFDAAKRPSTNDVSEFFERFLETSQDR
ncbi:hypothetical protein BaRGS_00026960, partial [Batillaria attramentaria]